MKIIDLKILNNPYENKACVVVSDTFTDAQGKTIEFLKAHIIPSSNLCVKVGDNVHPLYNQYKKLVKFEKEV